MAEFIRSWRGKQDGKGLAEKISIAARQLFMETAILLKGSQNDRIVMLKP